MAAEDDRILPNFDDSDHALECSICGIRTQDAKTYEKHMQGKKHQKKVTEVKLKANESKNGNRENENDEESEDSDDDNNMFCEVCNKYFSGFIPYAAHLKGGLHAKNKKKQKLREQLEDMPDVLSNENEESDSDSDGITPKPFARCKMCLKEFSGPESYQMHLKSAGHKKKEKQQKAMQNLKDGNQEDAKRSDDEEVCSKCHICDKSFSGIVPYTIHMKSNIHKKRVEKNKVADEMKQYWVNDESKQGYVCKECSKIFSDPVAFKDHLANNNHEKRKAKAALLDFLKMHPEIIFTSPLEEEDSEAESHSDEEDSKYYLICKLCHYSFSGPEAAQDHVKSKKHINLKKEKKMQKELKEQAKKSGDRKSSNKNSRSDSADAKRNLVDHRQTNTPDKNGDDFEII